MGNELPLIFCAYYSLKYFFITYRYSHMLRSLMILSKYCGTNSSVHYCIFKSLWQLVIYNVLKTAKNKKKWKYHQILNWFEISCRLVQGIALWNPTRQASLGDFYWSARSLSLVMNSNRMFILIFWTIIVIVILVMSTTLNWFTNVYIIFRF